MSQDPNQPPQPQWDAQRGRKIESKALACVVRTSAAEESTILGRPARDASVRWHP